MIHEWRKDDYVISTERARLDLAMIHGFLTNSYWARGISLQLVRRSVENSLPYGLYQADQQVGFGRVISDYATFAYVGDVFVVEPHRGRGLARWLMDTMRGHPELQGLRRWVLLTRDAHPLYRQVGFTGLARPERYMEIHDPNTYKAEVRADR